MVFLLKCWQVIPPPWRSHSERTIWATSKHITFHHPDLFLSFVFCVLHLVKTHYRSSSRSLSIALCPETALFWLDRHKPQYALCRLSIICSQIYANAWECRLNSDRPRSSIEGLESLLHLPKCWEILIYISAWPNNCNAGNFGKFLAFRVVP